MTFDVFAATAAVNSDSAPVAPGAVLLRSFACADTARILAAITGVTKSAPFRHMTTPGGFRTSVAMTNCGAAGWVSDKTGYRYDAIDPQSGLPLAGNARRIPRSCEQRRAGGGIRVVHAGWLSHQPL
jgi:alkylated DNA repair protein (DNA oxidative demethylase)